MNPQISWCPRCTQQISKERFDSNIVVCNSCGFVLSDSEANSGEEHDRRVLIYSVGICLTLCAVFFQVAVWDSHAIEVIPLKVKELIGTSSPADLERMAQICLDRQKIDCVEKAYTKLGQRDISQLVKLGQFEMNRGRYSQAVNTYRIFFAKGGSDLKASYLFAKALAQEGKLDEAAKYYDYVLTAKPDKLLQSAAISSYVRLLADLHRPDQVRKSIERVRRYSNATAYLMDDEYRKVSGAPLARDTASVSAR